MRQQCFFGFLRPGFFRGSSEGGPEPQAKEKNKLKVGERASSSEPLASGVT